jgi:hypothetical protein
MSTGGIKSKLVERKLQRCIRWKYKQVTGLSHQCMSMDHNQLKGCHVIVQW